MISLALALAAVTAQPTVRPTVPVAQVALPATGEVSQLKAEYVFTLGACSRHYAASDIAIMASLAEPSNERERGYLSRAFDSGFDYARAEQPSLAQCRAALAALAARLRHGT